MHGRHPRLDEPREQTRAHRQNFVVEDEARVVDGGRAGVPEPEIRARHGAQHVGEILAAHLRLGRRRDILGADDVARDLGDDLGVFGAIDEHREDVADIDFDLDIERRRDAGADGAHAFAHQRAAFVGKAADRAGELRLVGNDVVGRAGVNLRDRQDGRFVRIRVAADDRLQGLAERHRGDDRVLR